MGIAAYFISSQRRVVYFNVSAIKANLIHQLAIHQASDEQVNATTQRFRKNLEEVLHQYARRHDVMIIDSQFVIAGGKDVTSQITKDLSLAMREVK